VLDADQVDAELAAVEADLRLMQARMNLDKTRNLDSYSRLRVQLQLEQLDLDLARIRLQQAEGEFARTKKLLDDQIIARGPGATRNDFGYDVALRDRASLRAEVTAREKSVSELQTGVRRLEASGAAREEPADAAIEQAIAARREQVRRLQKPIVLRSPINGFVSVINHLPGSKVTAGEAILVVSAEESARILAWVRQPVTERPNVGDIVEVRRGILGRQAFETTIVKVGRQLEQINPTAVTLNDTLQRAEFGLPLIVKVPEKLDLIPGEAVQLRVIKRAARPAAH
jgi:multidrug resistance efflux pump